MKLRQGVKHLSNTDITFGLKAAEATENAPIINALRQLRQEAIPPPAHREENRTKFLAEAERMAAGTKEAKE